MMAMQEQDIQQIIAKAKSMNASLDVNPSLSMSMSSQPMSHQQTISQQQQPMTLPGRPTVSLAPATHSVQASIDFYKDKYIQGMEERLLLHNQNVQKETEIKQRESELFAILEYIQKLQAELQGAVSHDVPHHGRENSATSGNVQPAPMPFIDPIPVPSSRTPFSAPTPGISFP
jgi:hypothetical protein